MPSFLSDVGATTPAEDADTLPRKFTDSSSRKQTADASSTKSINPSRKSTDRSLAPDATLVGSVVERTTDMETAYKRCATFIESMSYLRGTPDRWREQALWERVRDSSLALNETMESMRRHTEQLKAFSLVATPGGRGGGGGE